LFQRATGICGFGCAFQVVEHWKQIRDEINLAAFCALIGSAVETLSRFIGFLLQPDFELFETGTFSPQLIVRQLWYALQSSLHNWL
jgi:hypothetical protein